MDHDQRAGAEEINDEVLVADCVQTVARYGIEPQLASYCLALDQDDLESCIALFTPDAVYEVYGRSFVGHDGVRKMMTGAPGFLSFAIAFTSR